MIFGGAAVGAAVLAVMSAGLAGPIAIAMVGSSFPGLTGAALTAASLATVGGGAIAIGGAGMAGGTALIVGGGVVLGLVGGGGAVIGAETIKSISKGTFNKADFEAMVNSLAKLVTVVVKVLDAAQNATEFINKVLSSIRELIRMYRDIADDMQLGIVKKVKRDNKNYLKKIIVALQRAYELIQKYLNEKQVIA